MLTDTWAYLQCDIDGDKNDASRSDFFGLNSYSWCGGSATFETAGYDILVSTFGNSSIPVFFSEYGCNEVRPRVFNEVDALYSPRMTGLSGGLVYEYSQEPSNYGLVEVYENGTVQLRVDFNNLQDQLNKLNITLIQSSNLTATSLVPPPCSKDLISSEAFSKSFDIPSPPEGVEKLIKDGISDPNRGKIVELKETEVTIAAYTTDGKRIEGLAINPLPEDESNTPTGERIEEEPSRTKNPPKPTHTGGSGRVKMSGGLAALAAAVTLLLFQLLPVSG